MLHISSLFCLSMCVWEPLRAIKGLARLFLLLATTTSFWPLSLSMGHRIKPLQQDLSLCSLPNTHTQPSPFHSALLGQTPHSCQPHHPVPTPPPFPIDRPICQRQNSRSPWLLVNLHSETLLWNAKDCRTVKEGQRDVQYVKQKDIFTLSLGALLAHSWGPRASSTSAC